MQSTSWYNILQSHQTLRRAALLVFFLFLISLQVFSQELGRSYTKEIGFGVSQTMSNNGMLRDPLGVSFIMRTYEPYSPWVLQLSFEFHESAWKETGVMAFASREQNYQEETIETIADFFSMKLHQYYFFPLQMRVLEAGAGAGMMIGMFGKERRGLQTGRTEESLPAVKLGMGGSFCVRYAPSVSEPIAYHALVQLEYWSGQRSASKEYSIKSPITVFTIQVGASYSY